MRTPNITRQIVGDETVRYLEALPKRLEQMGMRCESPEDARKLPFYVEVMRLYEYAIEGTCPSRDYDRLGAHELMDLMIYLDGLSEASHSTELGRYANPTPPAAVLMLGKIAFARHNLDMGDEPLSIAGLALLAGMDEKSVRNATNEKAADRLIVTSDGKHVVVAAEEARRWLLGRKGFVPTRSAGGGFSRSVPLVLSAEVGDLLRSRAASLRVDVETFIRQTFEEK